MFNQFVDAAKFFSASIEVGIHPDFSDIYRFGAFSCSFINFALSIMAL
jgi:hypothetical protein